MAKNGKLPKRIAGVKIPKKVRKRGGQIYALLESPVVAHIAAAGLIAIANSLATSGPAKKAGKAAKHAAADTGEATVEAASAGAANVADILALAAREAARAIKNNAR
jgi:hypothetical protein